MSLEEIKLWLRIDYNFENDLIEGLIQSAKSELLLSGFQIMTKMTWNTRFFVQRLNISLQEIMKVVDTQMTNLEARCLMKKDCKK
ncbi:phage gp6-like head-tail connector family protein [Staphylococcus aureus]|nr:phage gp6-like head-tail connector family protein [Staphylococcus aureus]